MAKSCLSETAKNCIKKVFIIMYISINKFMVMKAKKTALNHEEQTQHYNRKADKKKPLARTMINIRIILGWIIRK
jgi:hypothetical protein